MDNIIHFSNSWALYFGLGNLAVTKEGKGTWYSWKDSPIQVIISTQDSTSFDWLIPPFPPPHNVAPLICTHLACDTKRTYHLAHKSTLFREGRSVVSSTNVMLIVPYHF